MNRYRVAWVPGSVLRELYRAGQPFGPAEVTTAAINFGVLNHEDVRAHNAEDAATVVRTQHSIDALKPTDACRAAIVHIECLER